MYYNFSETSGTSIADSSGNGHTGTTNAMENDDLNVDGKFGSGINFDGMHYRKDIGYKVIS